MCGIVGIYRPDGCRVEEDELRLMLEPVAYRGPDGSGFYVGEGIGFGHVRLSIQDLSVAAAQPMVSHDKRFVITYNGEIYNVRELQHELRARGIELESTGDTEALLECLALFGVDKTLEKVEGMFAFGLWDLQEHRLVLARDRHGIKPLVYAMGTKGEVRFASEMKSLIGKCPEPDMCTLNAVLLGLGGTWGDATVFRKIRHVCAGEWICFRPNDRKERKTFFHVCDFVDEAARAELNQLRKEDVVRKVSRELEESVELRLVSDAPVAVLASGGVDSSLIAALTATRYPNLKLYHANVLGDTETAAATHLADVLGLEMRSVEVSDADVLDKTPVATYHYEIPMMYHNGSCVPFYMVSQLAGRDGIKVVLTGEGSDEYFLGYPAYAIRPYVRRYRKMLEFFQNLIHVVPSVGRLLWPRQNEDFTWHLRNLMFRYEEEERRTEASARYRFVRDETEHDWHVMCLDMVIGNVRTLLHRNDRLAMAWGLESRFPFLGHALARTAANLPGRYKVRKTYRLNDWRHPFINDKWIVREIASRHMPRQLSHRRKFGLRSSVYQRLSINSEYFRGGFMSEYYGLNHKAIDHMFATTTPRWQGQILMLEIWGQIFPLGRSVGQVREDLRRYVTIER